MVTPLDALPLSALRQRGSTKWASFPDDVLPLFVAEHDFPLAPAISNALLQAVERGDTGYTPPRHPLQQSFSDFAARRLGWDVDPARIRTTGDVIMGVVEILRGVIHPGDRVIVTPPVYPPFFDAVPEAGGVVETVPLIAQDGKWTLDLRAIDAAFAGGARAMLLCNPHNPTGTVPEAPELRALAAIAERYDAAIISDEIHAPLTRSGVSFTPFLAASHAAANVGFTVTSHSKAYNLAGLKCALMITASDRTTAVVDALPVEVEWRTGYLGMVTAVAAFAEASDAWLDALRARLDGNAALIADRLAADIPAARYRIPDASYLAWVDLRALGWGDDPADRVLTDARVAVNHGPTFGAEGNGFIRVNFGTGPDILGEALTRIAALA